MKQPKMITVRFTGTLNLQVWAEPGDVLDELVKDALERQTGCSIEGLEYITPTEVTNRKCSKHE